MTQPGATAPDATSTPQPHAPQPWPSAQQAAPQWPAQTGPRPPGLQGQPACAARSDSTRTIANVALVISGPTVPGAVGELVADNGLGGMADQLRWDPVPRVADEASVLCRATHPSWFGIVRFSGSDGSFDVMTMGGPDGLDGSYGPSAPEGPMP